jgi:hypothetical protein
VVSGQPGFEAVPRPLTPEPPLDTVQFSAKNADESGIAPDFNGGASAILAFETLAPPALSISDPGSVMLNAENAEKTVAITLS